MANAPSSDATVANGLFPFRKWKIDGTWFRALHEKCWRTLTDRSYFLKTIDAHSKV